MCLNVTATPIQCSWKNCDTACRPGATGGHTGGRAPQLTACAPPNENCAPPSEDCAPKKLTGSGLLERKSRSKLGVFVDWHQILWRFGDEDLFFFWRSPVFGRKNRLNFRFRLENPLQFQWRPFFFLEITCLWPGKTAWISDFGRKIPLTFCSLPCVFDPEWDKFLVPPCPSRIHTK